MLFGPLPATGTTLMRSAARNDSQGIVREEARTPKDRVSSTTMNTSEIRWREVAGYGVKHSRSRRSNPDGELHRSSTIHSSKLAFDSEERPKAAPAGEERRRAEDLARSSSWGF